MDRQIQLFQIANLIFTTPLENITSLNDKDIKIIQTRFTDIINSFGESGISHYTTNFIKNGGTKLPYNSMSFVGDNDNHLLLHFSTSYNEPLFFIIDVNKNTVKNYIDIEDVKNIINDETYIDINESLHYPRNLNRLFKNITDMNEFVDIYMNELKNHIDASKNDCFEIELDALDDIENR